MYNCFVNNKLYGTADDIKSVSELLEAYVKDCQENGKQQQEFRVVKEG